MENGKASPATKPTRPPRKLFRKVSTNVSTTRSATTMRSRGMAIDSIDGMSTMSVGSSSHGITTKEWARPLHAPGRSGMNGNDE